MSPINFDKYESEFTKDRKLTREGACGKDHWISAVSSGSRKIKPYRCGSCEDCLDQKGIEIQTKLQSVAYLHDLKFIAVKPEVADKLVTALDINDYARFPCQDGKDYIFSVNGPGVHTLDGEITYEFLSRRRKGSRKSGKLILMKEKKKEEPTIQITEIRCSSLDVGLTALARVQEFYDNTEVFDKTVDDASVLEVYNNVISMKIIKELEELDGLVFDRFVNKPYILPTKFEFKYHKELT